MFVTTRQLAQVAGISSRKAGEALARIADGRSEMWRGARLAVRTIPGRGGRSGLQYEVAVESLPDDLKSRFKATSNVPAIIAAPASASATRRKLYLAVLAKPLSFDKGSTERAQAIRALAQAESGLLDPETGTLKRFSVRTLQRLMAAYDAQGAAGLGRKRRSDAGSERVVISRRWDCAAASLSSEVKATVRAELVAYIRAQHKNHESAGNLAFKARLKLEEISRKLGVETPPGACDVPRSMIEAETVYRRAALRRLDAKAFADDLPGVRRTRVGMRPMQVVFTDVHRLDFVLREFGGLQRYASAVAWYDIATNRIWMTVLVLPKGEGVRNEHVIASFIEMALKWGLPETIYADNGSEFNCLDFLADALSVAFPGGRRVAVKASSGADNPIVRAKPYNARAKPIEGAFKNLEYNHFAKLTGYIGGDRMKSKTANIGRAPTPFPGDIEFFKETIAAALIAYHAKPQPKALAGLAPIQALDQACAAGWTRTDVDPEAFEMAFSKEETREVRQGCVAVDGRRWTCPELQSYLGDRVVVLIPKFWPVGSRLPIKDERGRLLGVAEEDTPYGYLDPAGAKEAGGRKNLRLVAARNLERSAPTIDPIAEIYDFAARLPKEAPAPIGQTVTASDEQKLISKALKESAKDRRDREAADREREYETQAAIAQKLFANMQKARG